MNYKWLNIKSNAEYMHDNYANFPCAEGVFRTVVNRSYYCAINTAAVFIKEIIGDDLPKGSEYHNTVISYFNGEIHQILEGLREKRRKADYELESGKFDDMAFVAINQLNELLELREFQEILHQIGCD